ncbi:hypothetical protein [uncultured Bacteroides sp.]|uniref:hypothetical protein n=1 Tax=uncultured Bacteroides sp. TaxID=162156 RepID=UPI002AAA9F63|nr:hypothetical protein [uncultured Bacteroides sp.]
MEEFKVDIWRKDNINVRYKSLNQVEKQKIIDDIAGKLKIRLSSDSILFTKLLKTLIDQIILLNINEPDGLECLVSKFNLNLSEDAVVNVIWDYDSIDCLELDTLNKYWEYIWYGTSDEMCLLYIPETSFFVVITDYGTMYYRDSGKE